VQLWSVDPVAPYGARLPSNRPAPGINEAQFTLSADGRRLAVADHSDAAVVWDLSEGTWRRQLCQILDRDLTRDERRQFLPAGQRSRRTCPGG
jgi:hypothetical protein